MFAGMLAGITWALESITLGIALSMTPFVKSDQAIFLAPFVSTFLHDTISAMFACIYNKARGNIKQLVKALNTKSGRYVALAAIIGGPVGMTGYVLAVANMGASIGAVSTAIFPAIGAVLAYFFLKEKMQWYRWLFLIPTLFGVYGLSYSPDLNINNFWIGCIGALLCAFGWGIEAVIIAKCVQDPLVTDEIALQIRQTTSAVIYGILILPILSGWSFTASLLVGTEWLIPTIGIAALFATVSYLFYYRAISQIGAAKSMALNITYSAWAILFTVIIFQDISILNTTTIISTCVVLVCGILVAADYKELFKNDSSKLSVIS